MITILKECLITYKGKDAKEQLVKDYDICIGDACEKCIYKDWHPKDIDDPNCDTLHGCGLSPYTYFRIKK